METSWNQEVQLEKRGQLSSNESTEVCVIGAGMAGLLCAYRFSEAGYKVIVLEENEIFSGQSGKTTAKITFQMGLYYAELLKKHGLACSKEVVNLFEESLIEYERIIKKEKIECDFEKLDAILYSKSQTEKLEEEAEASKKCGIECFGYEEEETPDGIAATLHFKNQAQFHPIKFIKGIIPKLEIYENSKVVTVSEQMVQCEKGTVHAKWIVFATHFPFINVPGFYFMKMHQERSCALIVKNVGKMQGMFYGIDKEGGSFRNEGQDCIVGGASYRCGENEKGGKILALIQKAKQCFPDKKLDTMWSAQDCMTLDGLPYIGRYSKELKNWFVITGFNKWGMIQSMVASILIQELIEEREREVFCIFDSTREMIQISNVETLREFTKEALHSTVGLTKEFLMESSFDVTKLEKGHGGIVEVKGKKVGVYKDKNGATFSVSTRCPHLGCELTWNPDELTWDCPCHGSRFDIQGNKIDNPAQENLENS